VHICLKQLKHLEQTLATYVYGYCNIYNIHMKHLQHAYETPETLENISLQHVRRPPYLVSLEAVMKYGESPSFVLVT
jgi:phage terminase small subunit